MKLEIIETPDYILAVSDEEIKEGEAFIDLRNQELDSEDIYWAGLGGDVKFANIIGKKIIAHQPKGNAPELDLPLLPKIVIEDDVEKLPNFLYKNEYGCILSGVDGDSDVTNEWNNYKAATKEYSEEDLRRAIEFTVQNVLQAIPGITSTKTITESFIQSLKQPKWFIAEHIGKCCGNQLINQCIDCKKYKPQLKNTTTNGKTYLIGKYE